MVNSNDLGALGEKIALDYLSKNKYKILETNWRYQHKEVDIIAVINNILCIVEVKTRSSDYISPKEAVNKKKQQNLIIAANEYVIQNNLDCDVRFDIIEIIRNQDNTQITHIKDAFIPLLN